MVRRLSTPRSDSTGAATVIACDGLTKDYGSGHGVFDLNLPVRRGETFGFIGPNGAGKTTTIRLLMDLIRPDRGTATVVGLDSRRDGVAVKRRVGYLPGELVAFPGVTAGYVIGLLAGLRGGVDPARITALAERFDLDLGRKYETLSHGNKQKVGLIQAFMHRPDLVILDEPTLGLDPLMQREFRHLVQETVADGATVFLSSHVLPEVEAVCDRIGLIRAGRLERVGSLNELRALRIHRVEAIFTGRLTAADIAHVPGVTESRIDDHLLTCAVHGSVAPLLDVLSAADVVELDSHEMSLEEVFLGELDQPAPPASPAQPATGRQPAQPAAGR
jgi:ABC-2 type transport system ATP-binding protein